MSLDWPLTQFGFIGLRAMGISIFLCVLFVSRSKQTGFRRFFVCLFVSVCFFGAMRRRGGA
jgi:hypothetical protein